MTERCPLYRAVQERPWGSVQVPICKARGTPNEFCHGGYRECITFVLAQEQPAVKRIPAYRSVQNGRQRCEYLRGGQNIVTEDMAMWSAPFCQKGGITGDYCTGQFETCSTYRTAKEAGPSARDPMRMHGL